MALVPTCPLPPLIPPILPIGPRCLPVALHGLVFHLFALLALRSSDVESPRADYIPN